MRKSPYWEKYLPEAEHAAMRREVDAAPPAKRRAVLYAWRATALAHWDATQKAQQTQANLRTMRRYDQYTLEHALGSEPHTTAHVLEAVEQWLGDNAPRGAWWQYDAYEHHLTLAELVRKMPAASEKD